MTPCSKSNKKREFMEMARRAGPLPTSALASGEAPRKTPTLADSPEVFREELTQADLAFVLDLAEEASGREGLAAVEEAP